VALSTMAVGWMGGAAASDWEGDDPGWPILAKSLLWLGPTSGNSKQNRDGPPRLPGRIEGINRNGL
jgi:hypothetical protein